MNKSAIVTFRSGTTPVAYFFPISNDAAGGNKKLTLNASADATANFDGQGTVVFKGTSVASTDLPKFSVIEIRTGTLKLEDWWLSGKTSFDLVSLDVASTDGKTEVVGGGLDISTAGIGGLGEAYSKDFYIQGGKISLWTGSKDVGYLTQNGGKVVVVGNTSSFKKLTLNSGTLDVSSTDVKVSGDVVLNGSTLNANAPGTKISGDLTLNNSTVNRAFGSINFIGNVTVSNDSKLILYVSGDIASDKTLTIDRGTVTFNVAGAAKYAKIAVVGDNSLLKIKNGLESTKADFSGVAYGKDADVEFTEWDPDGGVYGGILLGGTYVAPKGTVTFHLPTTATAAKTIVLVSQDVTTIDQFDRVRYIAGIGIKELSFDNGDKRILAIPGGNIPTPGTLTPSYTNTGSNIVEGETVSFDVTWKNGTTDVPIADLFVKSIDSAGAAYARISFTDNTTKVTVVGLAAGSASITLSADHRTDKSIAGSGRVTIPFTVTKPVLDGVFTNTAGTKVDALTFTSLLTTFTAKTAWTYGGTGTALVDTSFDVTLGKNTVVEVTYNQTDKAYAIKSVGPGDAVLKVHAYYNGDQTKSKDIYLPISVTITEEPVAPVKPTPAQEEDIIKPAKKSFEERYSVSLDIGFADSFTATAKVAGNTVVIGPLTYGTEFWKIFVSADSKLVKVLANGTSKDLTRISPAPNKTSLTDGQWALYTDGAHVAIRDNGSFDLDSRPLYILDPIAAVVKKVEPVVDPKKGGGGCSAASFGAIAVLFMLPLVLRKRK